MKEKIKKLVVMMFTISVMFSNMNVFALTNSKWKTNQNRMTSTTLGITESKMKITNIQDESGKNRKKYTITYTIPDGFDEDSITIIPNGYMNNCSMPGDDDIFVINIENKSKNNYYYVDNSFILSTEDFDSYTDGEIGSHIADAYTFTDTKIREQISFYRTKNTALQNLYGVNSTAKITSSMLQDSEIDKVIDKDKYPNGSKDLNKYYLDFYNNKYQTNAKVLEDLPYQAISELFDGNHSKAFRETNKEVIELAYNYLYNKLFSFTFANVDINDENSENYSVGSYMRKESSYTKANSLLNSSLSNIYTNTIKTFQMPHVYINGKYMTNIYQGYYIGFYLEFKLAKENKIIEEPAIDNGTVKEEPVIQEPVINDEYPLPPKTNCDE